LGDFWEAMRRHLEAMRRHLGGIWEAFRRHGGKGDGGVDR
jgi:hypothetical protein